MARSWRGFLIGAVAAAMLALPAWWARAQNGPAAGRLVAHEWGVWLLRGGAVDHLGTLAAESPPFVHRTQRPGVPLPIPNPNPNPNPPGPVPIGPVPPPDVHPPVARKPVLFLYAQAPTAVRITVGFEGGAPWLFFPLGVESQPHPSQRALSWDLQALRPGARVPLRPVAAGHWWNDLRRVPSSPLLARRGGEAERFVFYDGPVGFRPVFRIQRSGAGAEIAPLSTERTVWLVGAGGRFVQHDTTQGAPRTVAAGDAAELRRSLDAALRRAGLTAPESASLLDTWRDELFGAAGPRAVYLLPRAHYDAMLPLRIAPQPAQLVRVGLVIETL